MSMQLMRCHEARPYLSAYVDGELDSVLQERLRTHLASCALCSRVVARYQAVDSLIGTLPATGPSPEVLDRVLAATSSQNNERAIRQSLRRPDRPLAPRALPAFLVADTNLAAPIPPVRLRSQSRGSWVLAGALPTLAALLIVTFSFFVHQGRPGRLSLVLHPTPTVHPETELQKTDQVVFHQLAPKLLFTPVLPASLPPEAQLLSASVGTFSDGEKYLDVTWTLAAPFTSLHLREAAEPLSKREDYVASVQNDLQIWQLPGFEPWLNLNLSTGSGPLVVGENYTNISITLDISQRGGDPNLGTENFRTALNYLRITSLSIDSPYQPLNSIAVPASSSVVHFKIQTTAESGGQVYTWDVYSDGEHDQSKATLSTISGIIYTDYLDGGTVTRCNSQGECEKVQASDPSVRNDPVQPSDKVTSFFEGINEFVSNGELWNLGEVPAPPELEIGHVMVYQLAYVSGPYPMTIYVSTTSKQVIEVISETGPTNGSPGGTNATSPLLPLGTGSCVISYPLILYLDAHSSPVPSLSAPTYSSAIHIPTVATCGY